MKRKSNYFLKVLKRSCQFGEQRNIETCMVTTENSDIYNFTEGVSWKIINIERFISDDYESQEALYDIVVNQERRCLMETFEYINHRKVYFDVIDICSNFEVAKANKFLFYTFNYFYDANPIIIVNVNEKDKHISSDNMSIAQKMNNEIVILDNIDDNVSVNDNVSDNDEDDSLSVISFDSDDYTVISHGPMLVNNINNNGNIHNNVRRRYKSKLDGLTDNLSSALPVSRLRPRNR